MFKICFPLSETYYEDSQLNQRLPFFLRTVVSFEEIMNRYQEALQYRIYRITLILFIIPFKNQLFLYGA